MNTILTFSTETNYKQKKQKHVDHIYPKYMSPLFIWNPSFPLSSPISTPRARITAIAYHVNLKHFRHIKWGQMKDENTWIHLTVL